MRRRLQKSRPSASTAGLQAADETMANAKFFDDGRPVAPSTAFISRPPRRYPFQRPRRPNPPAPITGGAPRGSARPLSGREARSLAAPAVAGAATPTLGNGASGSYYRLEFCPGPPLSG